MPKQRGKRNALNKFMKYDEYYASKFEEKKYGHQIGKSMLDMQHKVLSKMVDEDKSSILDVGAGTGWISLYLMREKSASAVALDASREMLEFARNRAKQQKMELDAILGDAHRLPIRDRSFNYVICFRTLLHLKNPKAAISEMCRVSNQIIVDFQSKASISGISEMIMSLPNLDKFLYDLKENPMKGSRLSRLFPGGKWFFLFQIRNEFRGHEFEITETQKYYALPILFHRKLNRIGLSRRLEAMFRKSKVTSVFGSPVVVKAKRMRL